MEDAAPPAWCKWIEGARHASNQDDPPEAAKVLAGRLGNGGKAVAVSRA
jgi:hypothetical protein